MGHVSLKAIALVVRQHNIGAPTVMTSTAEEKAFLRVAVAAIPRVTELILAFPPDDRAGAQKRPSDGSLQPRWTMVAPR